MVASEQMRAGHRRGGVRFPHPGTLLVLSVALALVAGACSSTGSSPGTSGPAASGSASSAPAGSGAQKKFKIAFSNDNIGNQWRVQMVNDLKHRVATKYPDTIDLNYVQSEFDVVAQTGDLQRIILSKPDAIVMEARSATALNPTIKQACDQGILVYSFDQTATEACGYQLVLSNWADQSYDMAAWMCSVTGGKGTLLQDIGAAGSPLGDAFVKGWNDYFKASCPGLSVVAEYASGAAEGPGTQAMSNLLSKYPDVVGILGIGYCSSGVSVMQKLGMKIVPQTCFYTNASAIACEKASSPCFYWSAPPWIGVTALDNVVRILNGEKLPKVEYASDTNYFTGPDVTKTIQFKQKLLPLKAGVDYFPELSPDLALPVDAADYGITPKIALGTK